VSAHECPRCGREFHAARSLGVHQARVHGVQGTSRSARYRPPPRERELSMSPRALARRQSDGRWAEPLPARPRDAVALLETVIALAHYDALLGVDAADEWLRDLRTSIRRRQAR
jgi:hypothetical protein